MNSLSGLLFLFRMRMTLSLELSIYFHVQEPELIRREIEKKRRARLCGAGCGLTKSEYKHMIMTPKDKNRERRFHHPRHEDLEKAYGLRQGQLSFLIHDL